MKLLTKADIERLTKHENVSELLSILKTGADFYEICKDCKCDCCDCCNNPEYCEYVSNQ